MRLNPTETRVLDAVKKLRGTAQAVASRVCGPDATFAERGMTARALKRLVQWGLVKNVGGIYSGNEEQAPATGGEPEAGDVARDPQPDSPDADGWSE